MYAAPALVVEFLPHTPVVYAAPAHVVDYVAPAPTVHTAQVYVTLAPVEEYIALAPAVYLLGVQTSLLRFGGTCCCSNEDHSVSRVQVTSHIYLRIFGKSLQTRNSVFRFVAPILRWSQVRVRTPIHCLMASSRCSHRLSRCVFPKPPRWSSVRIRSPTGRSNCCAHHLIGPRYGDPSFRPGRYQAYFEVEQICMSACSALDQSSKNTEMQCWNALRRCAPICFYPSRNFRSGWSFCFRVLSHRLRHFSRVGRSCSQLLELDCQPKLESVMGQSSWTTAGFNGSNKLLPRLKCGNLVETI